MAVREPLDFQFKQMDLAVGLSFKYNFNFALVGHLLKGKQHQFTPYLYERNIIKVMLDTYKQMCKVGISLIAIEAHVC